MSGREEEAVVELHTERDEILPLTRHPLAKVVGGQ